MESLNAFFDFIKQPEIAAVLITVFLEILRRLLTPKALIIWGITHGFSFSIPQQDGSHSLIHTGTAFVKNVGRETAKDIEIYLNFQPEHFQIWPVFEYKVDMALDSRCIIKIPFLKKGEHFSIEFIQSRVSPPEILHIRAAEGRCKKVDMAPLQIFNKWINGLIMILLSLGVYTVCLILYKLFV